MFREMRRIKQQLPADDSIAILKRMTSGVLALSGDDDYPYALPISYVYFDNKLFFHCAASGHKIDAIKRNEKVSFCVIEKDEIIPDDFTTHFRSVIVFGKAHIIEDDADRMKAIKILCDKYSPDREEGFKKEIEKGFNRVCMVELNIEHITGKEALELTKKDMDKCDIKP